MRSDLLRSSAVLAPIGRLLYSAMFLMAPINHFKASTIAYAAHMGVPAPGVLVPLSGVIAFLGGLSVLLGFRARIGALLLIVFLVPVTFTMHAFWAVHDPTMVPMQMANFMKNMAMLGTACLIVVLGSGPVSLDSRIRAGGHRFRMPLPA